MPATRDSKVESTVVQRAQRVEAARSFAATWSGRGYEKGDTASFWIQLLSQVVGLEDVVTAVHFEERVSNGGFIDAHIPSAKTLIEQKALGVNLDKPEMRQGRLVTPFEQAKAYADEMKNSNRPDYIIVSNFSHFRIHDLDQERPTENYVEFSLEELPEQFHLLDFIVTGQQARRAKEQQVSMHAGELIGKLYRSLAAQYIDPESERSRHCLNVLCVRLVFCLFAEDAGLFGKDSLYRYLSGVPTEYVRGKMIELFRVLDTPYDDRDAYISEELSRFPYVNGGLFREEDIEIPQFTEGIVSLLVNEISRDTDWSKISPTIFGGVFESTLNPETRAKGGMHYTSPENIHKVIDPLFFDGLKQELESILTDPELTPIKKTNRLKKYHNKLSSLTFFDPACGSGNFLTETYLSLRRLENRVIGMLAKDSQISLGFENVTPIKVSLGQFYGLEINDFAVSVATTALWIAKLQANIETQELVEQATDDFPLRGAANIHRGNALTKEWSEIINAGDCDYIIGNPPFLGARNQSKEQKAELKAVFPKGTKNVGNIDYVAGWFIKAAQFVGDHKTRIGFVATNSVVQGEQVANIWFPIISLGFHIDFAHDTFRWVNESTDKAHVFCVIVGFSKQQSQKVLYHYPTPDSPPEVQYKQRLNPYLVDAPDAFVWNRKTPICDVPKMVIGSQPIDGGNYLFTDDEFHEFIARDPEARQYFHPWIGSKEFLHGYHRWVLWTGEMSPAELKAHPLIAERVRAVRDFRSQSKRTSTLKLAGTPQRFQVETMPDGESIVVPEVSSERRKYIPLGFIEPEVFASNLVKIVPNASLFLFGVLHSEIHNVWMRAVAGRLKSDYRYSAGVVYNNFVFPEATDKQRKDVEEAAQLVLNARENYKDVTLADMYDPDDEWMYPELFAAHSELDSAVAQCYGFALDGLEHDEREQVILSELLTRHAKMVS